ncbi:MAG: DUF3795 domain-containing protein [Deltaproteobacteria bacterium]|nr:DUF3795 domain-containing protein [Deltaproteobacteria bacterium]
MALHNSSKIGRRMFVKGLAGAAVCCACCSLDRLAASKEIKVQGGEAKAHLAAACGTYCGACPAYLNKHGGVAENYPSRPVNASIDSFVAMMETLQCDGCLSGGTLAGHCQNCSISRCAANTQNNDRCSECTQLPCYRITNLINQGNYPHRDEYLPNLAKIHEMGLQEWAIYEEERWSCPQCGGAISWYDTQCTGCGATRSKDLFTLFEEEPTIPDKKVSLQPVLNLLLE